VFRVVVYVPPLQAVFGILPLTATELGVCLVLSSSLFWAVEAETWPRRHLNVSHSYVGLGS